MPHQTEPPLDDEACVLALDLGRLHNRIDRLLNLEGPRYPRLWAYYRNSMPPVTNDVESNGAEGPYCQARRSGPSPRIIGAVTRSAGESEAVDALARTELIVENDIAWGIEIMSHLLAVPSQPRKHLEPNQERKKKKPKRPKPYRLKPMRITPAGDPTPLTSQQAVPARTRLGW